MADHALHHPTPHDEDLAYEEHTHHGNYVKIWAILLVLLFVSILGPELEIKIVTLITAFGIAIVKAYMVAKHFMHITVAPRFVTYLVATMLVFMVLFFAGSAPDVMKLEGQRWEKPSWIEANRDFTEHGAAAAHH